MYIILYAVKSYHKISLVISLWPVREVFSNNFNFCPIQRIQHPNSRPSIVVSKEKPCKAKTNHKLKPLHSVVDSRRNTSPEDALKSFHPSNLSRPHSFHASSLAEFDQSMAQKKTNTLAISPRMLKRWVARKSVMNKNFAHVYFPTSSSVESNPMRSVKGTNHQGLMDSRTQTQTQTFPFGQQSLRNPHGPCS